MNYVKAGFQDRVPKLRGKITHATVIREFIQKCLERELALHTSRRVYEQIKNWRPLFRKELLNEGIQREYVERVLAVAEKKIKRFILENQGRVVVENALPTHRYEEVRRFFEKYEKDPRMIRVAKKKNRKSTLPEKSDMLIFSEALSFPSLYFVTTDDHFNVLTKEIEDEFSICLLTHDNILQKMREWGWL